MESKHKKEGRGFFVVEKDDGGYDVMSEPEIMGDESVTLASGEFETRAAAEAELRKGLSDGTYEPTSSPLS